MWNRLAPYVLRLLDMWNRLVLYVLRLLGRHERSPGPENEAGDNINVCYQMVDEEDNSRTATGGDYDVFLSFRGPDTRNGFTDCLYEFMRDAGIRIFRDDEELRPGEKISEILQAIKRSQIYIPIFSKNYASSKWCLRELTSMVECTRQSTGKEILPIFYDVDPLDVKLETQLYKSALRKHEDQDCKEAWKGSLTTVARIKGWHLKDKGHGVVIKDIIQKVLQKITITKRCLPTDLVGIEDHIEAIKKWLHCDFGDVRVVIIHGIGGIGKTTLAKAVFNQLSTQFESHSFLSRELSPCCSIVEMQRKLVADIFSFSLCETSDFEEGNYMIKHRLASRRVLLVFDGMDENDQFMQLAKHCTSCGLGSRIIITTRDKSIFSKTKVRGLEKKPLSGSIKVFQYEMKEMHFDHALQLFNKLAFNTDSASRDLYDLSKEVVEFTGGLPLALEVIGSHLRTECKETWISTLEKLKEVPHEKVHKRLRISYDALEYRAKQIFLDIACFIVNKKKTNAMYIWEDCGFFPKVEIEVLINKSLIKIVDHDRIWMHEQLRALGREIIRQDHSRLWFLEMAYEKGEENVVALMQWRSGHTFTRKDFVNLTHMRFLELDGGNFVGNFQDILPKLRYFHWQNCPPKIEANNFILNRLIVLKLSGNIIIEEWSGWVKIMVASRLKVLNLARSKSLIKTPNFSEFATLERLVLKDFPRLAIIDPSIGKLERLKYFKIKWCSCVRELPMEIGFLTALRELILIQCFGVQFLPDSIGNLINLSRLVMDDTGLVELPVTIKRLVALEYMSLVNCTSLNELPNAVGKLRWLTELDLYGSSIEEPPPSVCRLRDLAIRTKNSEKRIPQGPTETVVWKSAPTMRTEVPLRTIPPKAMSSYNAFGYEVKQIFLDIACFFVNKKITNAIYMWEACHFFPEVQIDVLINKFLISRCYLDKIRMTNEVRDFGKEIVRRENIRNPGDRSRLWFSEMASNVVRVKKLTENVVALTLWRTRHNFTRKDFVNLMQTRFLELDGGNFAGNFGDILPELRWLRWRNCPPKLQANNFVLNHLVVLKLSGNITIEEWSGWVKIMVPSKLKVLYLARSKSLIKTPCFSEFMSLERLVLKDFPRLAEIDHSIGKLDQLIYLKIKRCPHLRELPKEIGCLTPLRELILIQGYGVCYLPNSIGNLRLLSRLVMEDTGLVELPDTIKGLVDLEHLCLADCRSLISLSSDVGELKSLKELDLSGTAIEELPPSLWNLEVLELRMTDSKMETQLRFYCDLERPLENCWELRELEPDGPFKSSGFYVSLPGYPMDILNQKSRTIVAPEFHEHHLSGRCPPKILMTVIFPQSDDWPIDIAARVPLGDTGIMSSSQPTLYSKNLILMLVSWVVRKVWMHDFRRKDEELLSLEFCDHCMSITSVIREFSPSLPCLEIDLFPQLSIAFSMTLYIDRFIYNLRILTKFPSPISPSTNLPVTGPWSRKKLLEYIAMWNSWHEEATKVQGSASRRSSKNRKSHRLRKIRGGRLRAKGKRNLTWLCLHNYLDKHLLMNMVHVCAGCCTLSPFIRTKLDCCSYVLEEACPFLLDSALDVKQKTRLARDFARVVKWLGWFINIEKTPKEDYSQFFEDMRVLLFHWCRRNRRSGHHRTLDADF